MGVAEVVEVHRLDFSVSVRTASAGVTSGMDGLLSAFIWSRSSPCHPNGTCRHIPGEAAANHSRRAGLTLPLRGRNGEARNEDIPRLFGTIFARSALPGKVTAILAETTHGGAVRRPDPRT